MADITEKTGNGELVTNRDQLVVVDNIEPLIKIIRGQQVMLDKDLATLYGVETRTLNQAVKRNIQRFPSDFRFQLAMEEYSKSQIEEYHSFREILKNRYEIFNANITWFNTFTTAAIM